MEESRQPSVPNPDPTVITTQNLLREIGLIKEYVDLKMTGVVDVTKEQFKSVNQRFDLAGEQRIEQKEDTKAAVDAALAAAKEAVAKSEISTSKALEQQQATFKIEVDSLRRTNEELKDRINVVDNKTNSTHDQKIGAREDRTGLYGTIGILITILLAAIAVINALLSHFKI